MNHITPGQRLPVLASLLCWRLAASAAEPPLTVQFSQCTEFAGVAPVDAQAARALLPPRYALVADGAGAKLVVRVVECAAVKVGALPARPARIGQIGLMMASPDGTATDPNTSINNYTLSYASNLPALVSALRARGVPAVQDSGLAYEFAPASGTSELYAAISPSSDESPTWFVHGTVHTPTVATPFLANWWMLNEAHATKMATTIPTILFDFSSAVSFTTSRLNKLGKLLPANQVENFPVSFRGAFESATMVVSAVR